MNKARPRYRTGALNVRQSQIRQMVWKSFPTETQVNLPSFDLKVKRIPKKLHELSNSGYQSRLNRDQMAWTAGQQLSQSEKSRIFDELASKPLKVYFHPYFQLKPVVNMSEMMKKAYRAIKLVQVDPDLTLVYRPKPACLFSSESDIAIQHAIAMANLQTQIKADQEQVSRLVEELQKSWLTSYFQLESSTKSYAKAYSRVKKTHKEVTELDWQAKFIAANCAYKEKLRQDCLAVIADLQTETEISVLVRDKNND